MSYATCNNDHKIYTKEEITTQIKEEELGINIDEAYLIELKMHILRRKHRIEELKIERDKAIY